VPDRTIGFNCPAQIFTPGLAIDAHPRQRLIVYNGDYRVGLYDVDLGVKVGDVPEPKSACLLFSRDGERLWGVIDDSRLVSWTLPDLKVKTSWRRDPTIEVAGREGLSCLAAGARWIAVGSRASLAHVLRASDGVEHKTLKTQSPIRSIAIDANEDLIACGLVSGAVTLFRSESGEIAGEIAAHQDTVNSVAFSPRGRLLATAGRDKTVAIWNTAGPTPELVLRTRSPSGRPVLSVKFNSDGSVLGMLVQNEHAVHLLHIDKLRSRLRELDLDWDDEEDPDRAAD